MPVRRTDYGELWPHIRSAVSQGRGVTETRDALRDGGLSFSNDVFSRLWRVETEVETYVTDEATMPLDRKPGRGRITRFPGARFSTKYIQRARAVFVDRATGQTRDLLYQAGSDRLLTRGQVVAQARDALQPVAESLDWLTVTVNYHSTLART